MRYREDNINIIIISISLSISISMELEEVSSVQFNGLSCQQIPKQSTPNTKQLTGRTTTMNSGSDRDPRHNPRIGSKTKPPSTSTSISIIIMKILLSSIPRIGMTEGKYDIGIIHGIINGEQGRSENDEIFFALETDHDLKMFGFECCNNTITILFDGMEVGFEDDGIHTTRTTALLFMFMFMFPFGLIQGSVSVAVVIIPNLNACWLEWKRGPGGCSLFVSGEGEDGCDFVELSSGGSRR